MYIYNYFIILLGVCVSYDTRFDTIHDAEKSKINSRYDSRFDNYALGVYTMPRTPIKRVLIKFLVNYWFNLGRKRIGGLCFI